MFEWHESEISEVSLEFGTDVKVGRTNIDSKRKRNSDNRIHNIVTADARKIVRKIASDASLLLLVFIYIISATLGSYTEALVAIPTLLISFIVACFINYFSEKRIFCAGNLLIPKTIVIENGKKIRLSSLDVEVGDLIYFRKGDIIPADARLVSSYNLELAEPYCSEDGNNVQYRQFFKNHELLYSDDHERESYDNMVYAASIVCSGYGSAIVTAIGSDTQIKKTQQIFPLIKSNGLPNFLNAFEKYAKVFSLSVLFSGIPILLLQMYFNTQNPFVEEQTGFLFTILVMTALATTSMGSLITAPSVAILSHTLYDKKQKEHGSLTLLSSYDEVSATDTLVILCPEVLTDKRKFVRRVFFSDKEFRFDSLKSNELDQFAALFANYLKKRSNSDELERRALQRFVLGRTINGISEYGLNNISDFSVTTDLQDALNCQFFRTDGGSTWRFSESTQKNLVESYYEYLDLGLNVYLYTSADPNNEFRIFEGMIAIGEEYPFSNGEAFSDSLLHNITPVLILESENDESVKFALNCGIVDGIHDIVLASDLEKSNKLLSDVPLSTRAYIGFGRKGTQVIIDNMIKHGRSVLPIIKDLSDKAVILPLSVYATHSEASHSAVKNESSVSLNSADAEKHSGGILDAVYTIAKTILARLKINIFKNYLTFATVFRISFVFLTLFAGASPKPMTALMILLSGLISDAAALLVIITARGTPCNRPEFMKGKQTFICAIVGILVSFVSFITTVILLEINIIDIANVRIFEFYLMIMTQMLALGAFLMILKIRTVKFKFNIAYISVIIVFTIYFAAQNWFSDSIYNQLTELAYSRIGISVLPFLYISGIIAFLCIMLVDKCFSRSK